MCHLGIKKPLAGLDPDLRSFRVLAGARFASEEFKTVGV